MSGPVPVVLPDGSTGTVPEESVAGTVRGKGRVLTPEEHTAAKATAQAKRAEEERSYTADDALDAAASFQHASGRGFGEAFGIPTDTVETGIASLFGDRAEKASRDYLKGLDERHPYISGIGGLGGNVAGSLVAGNVTGASRALAGPGGAKVALRMGVGGVENVVQATTKDVNEASLGDHAVNGEMLVANMPKHFLVGGLLTGAFEGGAHLLGKGVKAVSSRAVPALEEGASGAIGRELGLEGAEAVEAGGRVRGFNGGEVPTSRGALSDVLAGEQRAQRGASIADHAGRVDALEGAQTTEAALLSARQEASRKAAHEAARGGVRAAEGEAGSAAWEAAAGADARVSGAHAEGAARTAEARAAHAAAGEEALAAGERVFEAHGARESGIAAAAESANRRVSELSGQFEAVHQTLQAERVAAAKSLEEVAAEHAAATRDLQAAVRDMGAGGKPYVSRAAKGGSKMNYAQRAPKVGDIDVETGQPWTKESLAEAATTFAGWTGSEARVAEATRLTSLKKSLEAARAHAETHLKSVDGAIAENVTQARRAAKAAALEGERATARVANDLTAPIENASKRSGHAMREAERAQARVSQVEAETAAFVEKARGEGAGAVAKAEKRGAARIASAKADAEMAIAVHEQGVSAEKASLAKTHEAQRAKLPGPSEETTVDPLIKSMADYAKKPKPLISSGAKWAAGASVLHGNFPAAATALGTSFAAGAARNHGNLIAARMMRGLSQTLSHVDAMVRDGAASVLGSSSAKVANSIASNPGHREPSFEELSKKIIDVESNPIELEHRVRESVGHIAIDAPATYQEMLTTAQRANSYLYSILPVPQRDPHTLTPHLDPGTVSDTARYDFMQSARTIDDPLSLFADVTNGSITQAQVDAVQQVYPLLFDKMRNEVKRQAMDLSVPVNYEREIHIGTLLGQVTNEVLEDDFQSLMTKSYAEKSKKQASQNAGSGPSGSKTSKNLMSGSESIEGGQP